MVSVRYAERDLLGLCIKDSVQLSLGRSMDLIADACSRMTRNLTRIGWQQYIGNALRYQAICPNLLVEPGPKSIPFQIAYENPYFQRECA